MDQATLTVMVSLYLACLPLCLCCATLAVVSAGYLTKAEDQPFSFRVFVWAMRWEGESGYSVVGILGALLGLSLANLVPVGELISRRGGAAILLLDLGYFVVVTAWAANVVKTIRRTRSRHRTRKKG